VLSAVSVVQEMLSSAFLNLSESHRSLADRFFRQQLDLQARLDPLKEAAASMDEHAMARRASAHIPASRRAFAVGDSVLIAVPRAEKTDRKWKGPFEVVGTYGPTGALFAVVVRIPNNPDRRVFKAQIGRVKPHHMPSQLRNVAHPTPIVLEDGDVFYEVAAIIRRVSANGFLVSWKGFGRNADSVVPEAELRQSSPELLREYESRTVFGPPVEDFG
jgi:hypothetical protein